MIFQITLKDGMEYAQAKDFAQLVEGQISEFGSTEEIIEIKVVSDEEAKSTMLSNMDFDEDSPEVDDNVREISLFDMVDGSGFAILGSTRDY